MTRPFRRVAAVLAALLVALLANLSWVQVLEADALRQHPGNTRTVLEQFNRARGPIIVGSAPIATSARAGADGFYQRAYTDGPLYAAITGYYSLLYGATGIERSQDGVLSGTDPRFFVDRVQQLFAGRRQAGGAVTLSVDATAQQAAFDALAGTQGATVAIDAATGAILALVSTPSYDPQTLAPNDPARVRTAYARLTADAAQPLENRAVGVTRPTGAAFAIVTAAAALASGHYTPTTALPAPAQLAGVHTANARPCTANGRTTLAAALRSGCTTALAAVGANLGADALRSMAERLGYDTTPTPELGTVPSTLTPGIDAAHLAALGTGADATVLQLAMLGAMVANGGTLMDPYIVQDVRAQDLAVLDHAKPMVRATVLARRNATALANMLQGIDGVTACADCRIAGTPVHALTGGQSWFVGFAGHVAVATVVQSGPRSARAAAIPVLRAILARSR